VLLRQHNRTVPLCILSNCEVTEKAGAGNAVTSAFLVDSRAFLLRFCHEYGIILMG